MSKVTIELSEYNDLRDRYKEKCARVKELEGEIDSMKQAQASQIEDLQKEGKVAVMVKKFNFFDFGSKPVLESVANLDDVKEEVKDYFLNDEKVKLLDKEFEKLKETVQKPLEDLSQENEKLKAALEDIKSLPWYKRLFNKF
jgi:hypothetical protein